MFCLPTNCGELRSRSAIAVFHRNFLSAGEERT